MIQVERRIRENRKSIFVVSVMVGIECTKSRNGEICMGGRVC